MKNTTAMKKLHNNQTGMISITVTLVIMIMVTLIVSSFAVIVRREQRQVLDRQLSTQAFYAAEAGLEDARVALTSKDPNLRLNSSDTINSCASGSDESFAKVMQTKGVNIDPQIADNVEYTCVLIDTKPLKFKKTFNLSDGTYLVKIKADSNISSLRISWQGTSPVAYENNPDFRLPKTGLSNPMLRVNVFPGIGSSGLSRDDLVNGAHSMFLYPNSGTSSTESVAFVGNGGQGGPTVLGGTDANSTRARQGKLVTGNCNPNRANTLDCSMLLTDLDHDAAKSGAGEEYYVAIRPLYKSAEVEIEALNSTVPVPIEGSQAVVDVTGRAQDVLRRVQARIPLTSGTFTGKLPDGALETTDDICKLLIVATLIVRDDCAGINIPTGSTPNPSDPTGSGNADVTSGDDPNTSGSNAAPFVFRASFKNISANPDSVIAGCTWYWGHDNESDSYPASQCEYGDWVNHRFPDNQEEIEDSNGSSGCRIYTVRLVMRFTTASGLPDVSKNYPAYIPLGAANDRPGGICDGKYRTYRP